MLKKICASFFALSLSLTAYAEPAKDKSVPSSAVKVTADVTAASATLVCSKGENDKLLCRPVESGDVEFNTNNLLVLRGPIDSQSASEFVKNFHELEHRDEVQRIYIYVNSPGGSIFAGDYIANMIGSSKKEVVVVIDFAASMAFHISQRATKRLMLPTGTMMQHHASGGTGNGREFPNIDKQWDWLKRKVGMMNKKDSTACSKVSHDDFMKNIDRDWWLLADDAVAAGCVDAVSSRVTCSKDLSSKTTVENISFFGMSISLTWSSCPLETYPRKVEMRNLSSFGSLSTEQRKAADAYLMLVTDPLQYYNINGTFSLDMFMNNTKALEPSAK